LAGKTDPHRRNEVLDTRDVAVFLGLDVGEGEHHATGLTPDGKNVVDKPLPNSEPKMRAMLDKLTKKYGRVLLVVDQPASIGALPLAVARDAGCQVAYLAGLTMRRIANLYPGEGKTDAHDAAIIADAARTMPHTLRSIELDDEAEMSSLWRRGRAVAWARDGVPAGGAGNQGGGTRRSRRWLRRSRRPAHLSRTPSGVPPPQRPPWASTGTPSA
jgi:hypothetical protein